MPEDANATRLRDLENIAELLGKVLAMHPILSFTDHELYSELLSGIGCDTLSVNADCRRTNLYALAMQWCSAAGLARMYACRLIRPKLLQRAAPNSRRFLQASQRY